MVNQVLLNYFKEHCGAYSLDDLKEKAFGLGYPKEDIDEAAAVLRGNVGGSVAPVVQQEVVEGVNVVKKGGVKWMKIAAILGFVFLGLMIISTITSLVLTPSPDATPSLSPSLLSIVIIVVIVAISLGLSFVYLYGFFKLGEYTDSKLIRISSISAMVMAVLMIVLPFILVGIVFSVGDFGMGGLMPMFIIMSIVWLLMLSIWCMFYIGLIKIKGKVRFAKIAGIFGLVLLVMNLFLFLFMVFMVFNPMLLFGLMTHPWTNGVIMGYSVLGSLISSGMLLFNSLTLLDASKKYE